MLKQNEIDHRIHEPAHAVEHTRVDSESRLGTITDIWKALGGDSKAEEDLVEKTRVGSSQSSLLASKDSESMKSVSSHGSS